MGVGRFLENLGLFYGHNFVEGIFFSPDPSHIKDRESHFLSGGLLMVEGVLFWSFGVWSDSKTNIIFILSCVVA